MSKPPGSTVAFVAVTAGIALVVGAGGFWLGRLTLGGLGAPGAAPSASVTPTPAPSVVSTLKPGHYAWTELIAGSCLTPFPGPWENSYDVVACTTDHAAQVIRADVVPGFSATSFPGEAAVQQAVLPLCTEPGLVDVATIASNPDLAYTFAFAVTATQWRETGGRYVCFVSH